MCIITLIRTTKTWWAQMYSMDEHKAHRDNRFNFWEAFSTQQLAHSGLKNKGPAIQAIWEAAKWNEIHPAFLMENPKSIDVSLWNRQGPRAPSCGWRAYPNNPGHIVCFSAAQLLTFRRKTSGRHIGMDNKKKHNRCVILWEGNGCLSIHACGKGRWGEID